MRAFPVLAGLTLAGAMVWAMAQSTNPSRAPVGAIPEPASRSLPQALQAVRFVPNQGQWDPAVRYGVLGDTPAWLHEDGFTVALRRWPARGLRSAAALALGHGAAAAGADEVQGVVVQTRFAGCAQRLEAHQPLPGKHHFLVGPTARHRRDLPAYGEVRLVDVQPGIDAVFRPLPAGDRGAFEYDLELHTGADLSGFAAEVRGATSLSLDAEGNLRIALPAMPSHQQAAAEPLELVQRAPLAWQTTPQGRVPLAVRFRLLGPCRYGFAAPKLDPTWPATVDPGVVWSSYLGGGGTDSVNAVTWRPGVGLWVAGWAGSSDFPTTAGAYRTTGGRDGFVARLAEDGSALQFATYFGGSDGDEIRGLDVTASLQPVVCGFTHSVDLPGTAGAYRPNYAGASPILDLGDAFAARLAANGASVLGATYLGGSFDDIAEAIAVDPAGALVVAGWSNSGNFPTTPGAWQPNLGGPLNLQTDGFVAKLAADCSSASYVTYLGGAAPDVLLGLAIDPNTGLPVVAGWTASANFPVTANAYRTSNAGGVDMVVVRLNAAGTGPSFSTYLGGLDSDLANAVAVAADSSVWVGGYSKSTNFPATANAVQTALAGRYDGVVFRLGATGTSLPYATYLGGPGDDQVRGIAVHGSEVLCVGETAGGLAVTANAFQPLFGGGSLDGFAAHLTGTPPTLAYASYFGGTQQDALGSVVLANSGLAVLGGWSFATDFPTTVGAYQTTLRGAEDGVVLQLDLLSSLDDGLSVSAPDPALRLVAPGPYDLLRATLHNRTSRALQVESLRLLLAGQGEPARVQDLAVFAAVAGGQERRVAGPVGLVATVATDPWLPLDALWLPAGASASLRVTAAAVADPSGRTAEIATAVVDAGSWSLRAEGSGPGPTVRVLGTGRVEGSVLVTGALPGDADGDATLSVFDLRRLCSRLGESERSFDADGDGMLTAADVSLARQSLLGQPVVLEAPVQLPRGEWSSLRGVFPEGVPIEVALGGRAPLLGTRTPRELTLRVDANQPSGPQELRVSVDGRLLFVRTVTVP